ncbi:hypothetical protein NDU88_001848 [Pleurodeles waltl]|uniref:Uncharacterized protein n=1 Tax=Pleurodeles waltl TaxID=8319 RepID=A0AAV7T1N8_PLEWA|nr:hypothetical protein NDU88_001848 [Pleurodeles waltl]
MLTHYGRAPRRYMQGEEQEQHRFRGDNNLRMLNSLCSEVEDVRKRQGILILRVGTSIDWTMVVMVM